MSEVTVLAEVAEAGSVVLEWEEEEARMSAGARERVEERWREYLEEARVHGRTLFDGQITRVIGVRQEAGADGRRVVLRVGPGSYKRFVVTLLRDRGWFEVNEPGAIERAMGVSVLITRGEEALLGIRSALVSAYAGRVHLIGGVVECLGAVGSLEGIVEQLRREVVEELGLGELEGVGGAGAGEFEPELLGVVRDEFLGQPELVWRWEAGISLKERAGRRGDEEHSGWRVVGRGEIEERVWGAMTPVARYAWGRWRGEAR